MSRVFNIRNKLPNMFLSKEDKLKIYQRDADVGEKVSELYANTKNWLTVKSVLQSFHDEAVNKISQRNLPPKDLEWVNSRLSLISEIFKKFDAIRQKGVIAHKKLKEMKND